MKREKWIDSLKGIGILLVIIGHTNSPFFKIIYGLHMPLFFVISGFVYSRSKILNMGFVSSTKRDAKRYLLPYFLLSLLNFVFELAFEFIRSGITTETLNTAKIWIFGILWSYGEVTHLPNCTPLWFFVGLLVARTLLYGIMKLKSETYRILVCVGLTCIDMWLSITDHAKLPWNIDAAIIGCICMYAGYLLRMICDKKMAYKLVGGIVACALGLVCIMENGNVAVLPNQISNPFLFWGGSLLTSAGLIVIFKATGFYLEFLQWIGNNSAIVMGLNYAVRDVVRLIWRKTGVFSMPSCPWFIEAIEVLLLLCLIIKVWNYLKDKYTFLQQANI